MIITTLVFFYIRRKILLTGSAINKTTPNERVNKLLSLNLIFLAFKKLYFFTKQVNIPN